MNLRLGTYFRIPLFLHWSGILAMPLYIASGTWYAEIIHPEWRLFDGLFSGMLYASGLFISVVLHEYGHILAGRWFEGSEAHSIHFHFLGGLAFIEPLKNETSEGHAVMAAGGPFVSAFLSCSALICAILGFLLNMQDSFAQTFAA